MLQSLWIKNYILIDELTLSFHNGMSAFTGETGAGKSILIDALALLCGARVSSSIVRQGEEKAIIEGVFQFQNKRTLELLQESGFDLEEEYVVTREVSMDGKSTARLNRRVVTVSLLKELLENEVDIHSQRDNQYLLDNKTHIHLLDAYGVNKDDLKQVKEAYLKYRTLKKNLEQALETTFNEDELSFLQFQIQEIEEAALELEEDVLLEEKQRAMSSFEKTSTALQSALVLLKEDSGVLEKAHEAIRHLEQVQDNQIQETIQVLENQYHELFDSVEQISDYYNNLEYDEAELNRIQERLFLINRLKRKYGNSIPLILEGKQSFEEKIALIENKQAFLEQAEKELKDAEKEFIHLAIPVKQQRKAAAKNLEQEIKQHLIDLELPNAQFQVVITSGELEGETGISVVDSKHFSETGTEQVEFYISMNPGEPLRPLAKVASGGELSRLMLGLKTVFSRLQGLSTIVFDEIDTGVSGSVATAIGLKMRTLATEMQVFSVTHLAQVATTSKYHYFVYKTQSEATTTTFVKELSYPERIQQLALISTGTTSQKALTAAEELYVHNQELILKNHIE